MHIGQQRTAKLSGSSVLSLFGCRCRFRLLQAPCLRLLPLARVQTDILLGLPAVHAFFSSTR